MIDNYVMMYKYQNYDGEIVTDKITTNTVVALTYGNFSNLYSTHYIGDTFNQCIQGSC